MPVQVVRCSFLEKVIRYYRARYDIMLMSSLTSVGIWCFACRKCRPLTAITAHSGRHKWHNVCYIMHIILSQRLPGCGYGTWWMVPATEGNTHMLHKREVHLAMRTASGLCMDVAVEGEISFGWLLTDWDLSELLRWHFILTPYVFWCDFLTYKQQEKGTSGLTYPFAQILHRNVTLQECHGIHCKVPWTRLQKYVDLHINSASTCLLFRTLFALDTPIMTVWC